MSLLDHYWTLASEVPEERINAAQLLIKGLQEKDSQEDWDYAFNRLVRGLSSSNGGARLGFSMALAEILEVRKSHVSIDLFFKKIAENFELTGSLKGYEERGILFGRLFALQTMVKSSLWKQATVNDWKKYVDEALDLSLRKPWLREPVFFSLCETIKGASEQVIQYAFDGVSERDLSKTCEGIAIALIVDPKTRHALNTHSAWHNGDPLHRKNLLEISRVLKTVPVGGSKTNSWKPELHFVWRMLLAEFLRPSGDAEERPRKKQKKDKKDKKKDKEPKKDAMDLSAFWRSVIDEGLLAQNSSTERKLWGYAVFNEWAPHVDDIKILFTPNLVRSLSNQLAQNDRSLHKMAKLVVQTLLAIAKQGKSADIITAILAENPFFDHTSKSRTVQDLMTCSEDPERIVKLLLEIFNSADTFSKRQWAINSVFTLLKAQSNNDVAWIAPVLDTLVPFAYFDVAGDDSKLAELAQQRVSSILSVSMNCTAESTQTWPYYVYRQIKDYKGEGNLKVEFDDEIGHSLQRAEQTLEKIHKKRMSSRHVDSPQLQAFELLFSMVLLQIYASSTEAVAIVDELLLCYNNIAGQSRHQDITDETDEVDASQVLTEVLISFLSQKSALLRKLSEDVWGSFAEKISASSLQLLFDIIIAKESLEGQSELFDVADDEAMEDDDEDEEGEEEEEEEEEEESSEDNDSDNDNEGEDGLDEAAKSKLAAALGVAETDDDEESMDDEQMTALDGQLAAIFRERQNMLNNSRQQAQEHVTAKENITALKGRILDLLDIFVSKQPSSLLCLNIIAPLLKLMQITKDVNLGNKAREQLRKICKNTTISLDDESLEDGFGVLEATQDIAQSSTNKPLSLACNQAAVFTTKLLLAKDKTLISRVTQSYSSALEAWVLNPKSKTTANMFIDFINFLAQKR